MSKEKTIIENYEEFKSVIDLIVKDFEKFNIKNTKVAGVRVKSNLLICRKLSEVIENQIMEKIRNIPSKHRADFNPTALDVDVEVNTYDEKTEVSIAPVKTRKPRKPRRANKPKAEQTA